MPRIDSCHKNAEGDVNRQSHPRGQVSVLDHADVTPILTYCGPVQNGKLESYLPCVVFRGPVEVKDIKDYFVLGPIGSRNDFLTVTFKPELRVTTGCFSGTLQEFETEVGDHTNPEARRQYQALIAVIRVLAETRRQEPEPVEGC